MQSTQYRNLCLNYNMGLKSPLIPSCPYFGAENRADFDTQSGEYHMISSETQMGEVRNVEAGKPVPTVTLHWQIDFLKRKIFN